MVSETIICGTLMGLCATMNNVPTEEVVAQISYDTIQSAEHLMELVMDNLTNPYSPREELMSKEVYELFEGYFEYEEEQERLAELERQRIAEEQAREKARQDELARQQEQARQRALELERMYPNKNYRQTYYSVQEGETQLGSGYYLGHSKVKTINNIMNYYDSQYGWLPIYAININEVLASGLNSKGTPNLYGSVIEIKYSDGSLRKGIVLDACGACAKSSKIDLWVYNNDSKLDVSHLEFRYLRKGW